MMATVAAATAVLRTHPRGGAIGQILRKVGLDGGREVVEERPSPRVDVQAVFEEANQVDMAVDPEGEGADDFPAEGGGGKPVKPRG